MSFIDYTTDRKKKKFCFEKILAAPYAPAESKLLKSITSNYAQFLHDAMQFSKLCGNSPVEVLFAKIMIQDKWMMASIDSRSSFSL